MRKEQEQLAELALRVSDLAMRVAELQARVTELEFHKAVGAEPGEEKQDPKTEQRNRDFAEGLDAILSYDGRAKNGSDDVAKD